MEHILIKILLSVLSIWVILVAKDLPRRGESTTDAPPPEERTDG